MGLGHLFGGLATGIAEGINQQNERRHQEEQEAKKALVHEAGQIALSETTPEDVRNAFHNFKLEVLTNPKMNLKQVQQKYGELRTSLAMNQQAQKNALRLAIEQAKIQQAQETLANPLQFPDAMGGTMTLPPFPGTEEVAGSAAANIGTPYFQAAPAKGQPIQFTKSRQQQLAEKIDEMQQVMLAQGMIKSALSQQDLQTMIRTFGPAAASFTPVQWANLINKKTVTAEPLTAFGPDRSGLATPSGIVRQPNPRILQGGPGTMFLEAPPTGAVTGSAGAGFGPMPGEPTPQGLGLPDQLPGLPPMPTATQPTTPAVAGGAKVIASVPALPPANVRAAIDAYQVEFGKPAATAADAVAWYKEQSMSESERKAKESTLATQQSSRARNAYMIKAYEAMSNVPQEAIDINAEQFLSTGQLPPTGRGNVGAIMQAKTYARAAELAESRGMTAQAVTARRFATKAASGAMGALQRQQSFVESFSETANKNADIALRLSEKVDRTGSPVLNRWLLKAKGQYAGDADVAAFESAIKVFANEWAKVVTGQTSGQAVSDAARKETEALANAAQNPSQFRAVVGVAREEMENRRTGFRDTMGELKGIITPELKPPPMPAPAPSGSRIKILKVEPVK